MGVNASDIANGAMTRKWPDLLLLGRLRRLFFADWCLAFPSIEWSSIRLATAPVAPMTTTTTIPDVGFETTGESHLRSQREMRESLRGGVR